MTSGGIVTGSGVAPSFPGIPERANENERRWLTFHGTSEAGARYGYAPFTAVGSGGLNPIARGAFDVGVFGVPLTFRFDLGSDLMTQSWRNMIKLSLNTTKMQEEAKRAEVDALGVMGTQIDSLEELRASLERQKCAARSAGERYRLMSVDTTLAFERSSVDTALHVPQQDSLGVVGAGTPGLPLGEASAMHHCLDSLDRVVGMAEQRSAEVNSAIEALLQQQARAAAVINADKQGPTLGRFWTGIRRLEIGTIMPVGSTFLINGVNLQGVSYEMAMKHLFIAFDHGRTFDDAWRTRDRSSERLRDLQETIFLQDGRSLEERKLTSLRFGAGMPEGTHVHIGVLRGTRAVDIQGSTAGPQGDRILNHVVELDAGVKVTEGHMIRFVVARSILRGPFDAGSDNSPVQAMIDRRSQQNQAIQLAWSSRFDRTATQVDLTGRAIDPLFHSMGMSFVRTGSRLFDAVCAQPFGKRLRVKVGYRIEDRTADDNATVSQLQRYRVQMSYRLFRWLTARGMYLPMRVSTTSSNGPAVVQRNDVVQFGGDLRKRCGRSDLSLMVDATRYLWRVSDDAGISGQVWYWNSSANITRERWSVGCTMSAFADNGADTLSTTLSLGVDAGWNDGGRTELRTRVSSDLNRGAEALGWTVVLRRSFFRSMTLSITGGRYMPAEFYFGDAVGIIHHDPYSCEVTIGYSW
ncbi:MAG: hypothetical protein ABI432_11280 [Flavobacteriales bacterium]